ncbi:MAG: PEGA domain-containing protein, partial [Acidobacteriota bacterium]
VPEPEPERRAAPRAPRTAAPPPAPAAPAAPTTATLTIDSDVTGASVFIDRVFVGETPVTIPNLAPGTRQLQLSADGYESIRRSIDVEAGPARLTLRFREVRLDQRLNVVHKHGMGSCEGTLVATIDGLRYETSNRNDGFTLAFDQLDTFTVDYMDKNLRVKQRGGRTWNFTQRDAANADALFVFHRDVEAARAKLAQGYAPVKP